jgi:ActR/RegA family two-component response regulator
MGQTESKDRIAANEQPKLLFVDDEESILTTFSMLLEANGFTVTSAATVAEALRFIANETFDVLIADLNVGSPGDGFTIVSAMRRSQPNAATFILTGYPAFETALEAIRQQVDDYFVKPTEIEHMVSRIRERLSARSGTGPAQRIIPKRLPEVLDKCVDSITGDWLSEVNHDPELAAIRLSETERKDHVPDLLRESVNRARGIELTTENIRAAARHGATRRRQGYTVPLLVREANILQSVLGNCIQQNLLEVKVSYLVPDMILIFKTIQTELEASIREFVATEDSLESATKRTSRKPQWSP